MTELFLSRARLRRDAPIAALANLLVPEDAADRAAASHRLVWALFADAAGRRRDFLWREEKPGHFMALSARPPADPHGLFDLESKSFAPVLSPGDRLGFTLRANPVVARPEAQGQRGKRHDVVMDLLRDVPIEPPALRSPVRGLDVGVDGYDSVRIPRAAGKPAVFGVVDFSGVLQVRDPACFLARLTQGFGRARAFGCGLMLIRRAR